MTGLGALLYQPYTMYKIEAPTSNLNPNKEGEVRGLPSGPTLLRSYDYYKVTLSNTFKTVAHTSDPCTNGKGHIEISWNYATAGADHRITCLHYINLESVSYNYMSHGA